MAAGRERPGPQPQIWETDVADKKRIKTETNGFTLIELLVVIAIIGLLLSIILPSLRLAKEQGRKIVCKSNLSQVAKAVELYEMQYNCKRFVIRKDASETDDYWMGKLAPFLGDVYYAQQYQEGKKIDILLCPSAPYDRFQADPSGPYANPSGQYGTARTPWSWARSTGRSTIGSIGINGWVGLDYYYETDSMYAPYFFKNWMDISPTVPLFADCVWTIGWPRGNDVPPETLQGSTAAQLPANSDNMRRFCIDRHSRQINIIFRDLHADTVKLEALWTLHWSRGYQVPSPLPRLPNK